MRPSSIRRRVSKHVFSLVELVVALLLLTFCGAVCLMNFKAGVDENQAKSTLQQIERKLELAALLSQALQDRVYVVISGEAPVQIFLDSKARRTMPVGKRFLFKEEALKAVQEVSLGSQKATNGGIHIAFYPDGIQSESSLLQVHFLSQAFDMKLDKYAPHVSMMAEDEIDKIFPKECLTQNDPSH